MPPRNVPPGMKYHELNISTSTITKEIMAALQMHYA
jgi:hypothetical protein